MSHAHLRQFQVSGGVLLFHLAKVMEVSLLLREIAFLGHCVGHGARLVLAALLDEADGADNHGGGDEEDGADDHVALVAVESGVLTAGDELLLGDDGAVLHNEEVVDIVGLHAVVV